MTRAARRSRYCPDADALGITKQLCDGNFQLVLMDMLMPVMGGEECARLIRRHLRMAELPVIGLTAAGCIEDRERCIAAGMNDYLTKPFEFDDLVAVMGKYVS